MASYYYLISSLPTLKAEASMPFSYDEFLKMCENTVGKDTYDKLSALTLKSEDSPFLKQWGLFYNKMMNSLCRQRKIKLGKSASSAAEKDLLIDRAVDEAMSAENPLEAEKILLKCQFEFLDGLVGMHYFDDFVLFGYAVKLKLLERQSVFETESGKQEFKRLFDGIQQQIASI